MKKILFLLLLSLVCIISCSDEDSNPIISDGPNDTIAPYAISNLQLTNLTGNSALLIFTTPGDDTLSGRAREYDVRYSESTINEANFDAATEFIYNTQPRAGGLTDSIEITGINSNTAYYFAVKVADEVPNWSPISNVVSGTTLLSGNWTIYNTTNSGIISDTVLAIGTDFGSKYFVTQSGVSKLLNNNWEMIFESQIYIVDSTLDSTLIDSVLNIWDVFYVNDSTLISNPNSITFDQSNAIWLGLENSGVAKIDNSIITYYNTINSNLTSNGVRDVLASSRGIWVGTFSAGLFLFDGDTTWTQYTTQDGLNYNGIECFEELSNGNLWIGLNLFGASLFDGLNFENYDLSNNFINQSVWSIDVSVTNEVLFGTNLNGVYVYDGAFTRYITGNSGLVDNTVISVTYDNNGNIWAGTQFGLSMFNGTDWVTYTTANSELPSNFINSLSLDMFGNLLIGTNAGAAILELN